MSEVHEKESRLKVDGAVSLTELHETVEYILPDEHYDHPVAVIECIEGIPCNPCETACPVAAIVVGDDITTLPVIDPTICTGCGLCVAACPGLAIYLKQQHHRDGLSYIAFPYEYLPLPEKGQAVTMVDRRGQHVCSGTVVRVIKTKRFDRTAIVHATYDSAFYEDVVNMARL
jgi:Fe-S-cluster-containing hydrogenase component 2